MVFCILVICLETRMKINNTGFHVFDYMTFKCPGTPIADHAACKQ